MASSMRSAASRAWTLVSGGVKAGAWTFHHSLSEEQLLLRNVLRTLHNGRLLERENWTNQSPFPRGDQPEEQEQQKSSSGESEIGRWFSRKSENESEQGRLKEQGSLNNLAVSRWLASRRAEGKTSEQDVEETTGGQPDTRRLNLSWPKLSSSGETSAGSSWFGLNKETPESERERLEVSMQRLALMSKLGDNSQASSFMFLPPKDELLRKYFRWNNLSSPERRKAILTKVRQGFQIHKTDCGSSQVQIAQLTTKIKYMTKHMQTHRKDVHSRKGLDAMVQQRRKLLKYLRRKDWDGYCGVITKLGLRDNVMDRQKR